MAPVNLKYLREVAHRIYTTEDPTDGAMLRSEADEIERLRAAAVGVKSERTAFI